MREEAEKHGIAHEFPCRMITLDVHSSLEAVGFIARIATELARRGMGVNPVAGFHHDHLFVPEGREGEAMASAGGHFTHVYLSRETGRPVSLPAALRAALEPLAVP